MKNTRILHMNKKYSWEYDLAKKQERKQQKTQRQDRRNKKDMLLMSAEID